MCPVVAYSVGVVQRSAAQPKAMSPVLWCCKTAEPPLTNFTGGHPLKIGRTDTLPHSCDQPASEFSIEFFCDIFFPLIDFHVHHDKSRPYTQLSKSKFHQPMRLRS